MAHSSFQFPVITPILARHAEDAAFYWSQLDRSAASPQLGFDRVMHFNRLHDAHLEGLSIAGSEGWVPAFSALQRWQKAGEAYVCTRVALRQDAPGRLTDVLKVVSRRPEEMLRGVISAVAWSDASAHAVIHQWSRLEAEPVAQVAALRAAALLDNAVADVLAAPLDAYLSASSPEIRAAACRAAALADGDEVTSRIHALLESSVLAERAEAAIALLRHEESGSVWEVLRDAVTTQAGLHDAAAGWYRKQSARRLRRWTMELAWACTPGAVEVDGTLSRLPPREALTFALCHGDLAHLPFVAAHTATSGLERYAGWVWQTLSGIELLAQNWTRPEPDPATIDHALLVTEAQLDADDGLPLPNPDLLIEYSKTHALSALYGKRVVLGRELNTAHALVLLDGAPQAIRALAARALRRSIVGIRMDIRTAASHQRQAMLALRHVAASGSIA